jgi:tRNA(fMet)-specific endonuclease VapC
MIRFLLDTDHVSLHERGHPALRTWLAAVPPDSISVSVITVEEMIRGRLAVLARRTAGAARIRAYTKFTETVLFFSSISVVPFDLDSEQIFQSLRTMRLRVGSQDLRIAAIVLANKLALVTRNRRDFERIPELSICG